MSVENPLPSIPNPSAGTQIAPGFFPRSGPFLIFIPIIVLISVLISASLVLLDNVHVITGRRWTGIDVFMGIFGRSVMTKISPASRVEVAKRLTPTMLFLMPSIASVATTAGYYLAVRTGLWSLTHSGSVQPLSSSSYSQSKASDSSCLTNYGSSRKSGRINLTWKGS